MSAIDCFAPLSYSQLIGSVSAPSIRAELAEIKRLFQELLRGTVPALQPALKDKFFYAFPSEKGAVEAEIESLPAAGGAGRTPFPTLSVKPPLSPHEFMDALRKSPEPLLLAPIALTTLVPDRSERLELGRSLAFLEPGEILEHLEALGLTGAEKTSIQLALVGFSALKARLYYTIRTIEKVSLRTLEMNPRAPEEAKKPLMDTAEAAKVYGAMIKDSFPPYAECLKYALERLTMFEVTSALTRESRVVRIDFSGPDSPKCA